MPLKRVQSGRTPKPPRVFVYGTEGVGKSTFAARARKPVFVPTEDGLDNIDCDKFPLAGTFEEVLANLEELRTEDHDYETVATDSLDWLERLLWDSLCRHNEVKSIEEVGGGYGKGYLFALDGWRRFLHALDLLRSQRGMTVICIAHAKIERFEDPEGPSYDRYAPRLHKLAAGLVNEWSDAILFATKRMRTDKEKGGFNKEKAKAAPIGANGGERVLRCVGRPGTVAKNRFGIGDEIPLSWEAFEKAMVSASTGGC